MSNIVRSSSYRHVFGTVWKNEQCYLNMKPLVSALDSNFLDANSKFFATPWNTSGGGALCVHTYDQHPKAASDYHSISAPSVFNEFAFSPFHDNILASANDSGKVYIWSIPEGGLTENMAESAGSVVTEYSRKAVYLNWHPSAENILLSASNDPNKTMRVQDLNGGQISENTDHQEPVISATWDYYGKLVATSSKDKALRIINPRDGTTVHKIENAHEGAKGFRAVWVTRGDDTRVFTVGATKSGMRQIKLWDLKNLSQPLTEQDLDTGVSMYMPFYDEDTNIVYLAGKGETSIKYFEVNNDAPCVHFLSQFQSAAPQKGMCRLPKTSLDVLKCETFRFLKLHQDKVEVISMTVPRKSDTFQDDIFPDTRAPVPAVDGATWFSGVDKEPVKQSMRPGEGGKVQTDAAPKKASFAFPGAGDKARITELEDLVKTKDARIAELEAKLAALGH
eukprot:TRINITY_DN2581_c0_g1::TRINITY_DN2581_c0_g1_i1::g.19113::m.19113 TRINITY_DN2581_c0_g1::TRINITY_DN2581_c0_g1_i1::g.19113  ORF type:complete len:470 (+),score=178.11,sp/Q9WUM4/COR1C_MOUSE/35.97/2e-102,DUF1900/PF08954.6/3.1e-50,DUF1899/PF08953.6/1.3e-18,WD40/PF00400.27/2.6,WD40/PF00400.27/50,WD40/PF00400.27/0.0049,WD40/PF00400.27/3.9e+03,MMS1_N/PF10433.4/0.14 TRINITY_DN2581_c0_g1_i1:62-1411(+)